MGKKIDSKKLAGLAVELLKQKKGRDVVVLDVKKISDFTDYLVIASGTSDTHIRALFSEVEENLPIPAYKKEMRKRTKWAVLDYGGVVVHIFHSDFRKFYDLESTWSSAKKTAKKETKKRKKNVKRSKRRN